MQKEQVSDQLQKKVREIEIALSNNKVRNISLLQGQTGIAIFYFHLFLLTKESVHLETCQSIILSVVKKLPRVDIGHSFYNGFTGVAWGLDYLKTKGAMSDGALLDTSGLDEYIYNASIHDMRIGKYDYLHGGLGAALYALRKTDDRSNSFLESLIDNISRLKESDAHGFLWADKDYEAIASPLNSRAYDLGISHGMQSILEILRRVYVRGILKSEILSLLDGTISWIISQKFKAEERSLYPGAVFKGNTLAPTTTALAWCYGDLTLGLVLYRCAKTLGNSLLQKEALNIMGRTALRLDPLESKYLDACFCHGTSGFAHIFQKLYDETGNHEFRSRSQFWLEETLKLSFRNGPAGYRIHNLARFNNQTYHRWKNDYSLLHGISGIGLVMLSNLTSSPGWDECLLL